MLPVARPPRRDVRETLDEAREAGQRFRRDVYVPLVAGIFFLLGISCMLGIWAGPSAGPAARFLFVPTSCFVGTTMQCLFFLALLPTDAFLMRVFFWYAWPFNCLVVIALCIFVGVAKVGELPPICRTVGLERAWHGCWLEWLEVASLAMWTLTVSCTCLIVLRAGWRGSRTHALEVAWRSAGVSAGILTPGVIAMGLGGALGAGVVARPPLYAVLWFLETLSLCCFCALGHAPAVRSLLQHRLAMQGEGMRTAAGIAALIGGRSAPDVIAFAHSHLRAIPASQISEAVLRSSVRRLSVYAMSKPVRMGDIDAFISHSHHDDAAVRIEAIHAWRARFIATYGREPLCWVDVYCIDPRHFEECISSLPVFLAQSRHLLVLVGRTYLSRLWTVAELFVFLEMGAELADIEAVALAEWRDSADAPTAGAPPEAQLPPEPPAGGRTGASLEASVAAFDVRRCQCVSPEDRTILLSIVRQSFAGLDAFNERIRMLLASMLGLQLPATGAPEGAHGHVEAGTGCHCIGSAAETHSTSGAHAYYGRLL
jgi:diadenosine tetraphosphatase ApaH/serine/threonine PP2A family protein phosphatase